jgi:hypothetical protein
MMTILRDLKLSLLLFFKTGTATNAMISHTKFRIDRYARLLLSRCVALTRRRIFKRHEHFADSPDATCEEDIRFLPRGFLTPRGPMYPVLDLSRNNARFLVKAFQS